MITNKTWQIMNIIYIITFKYENIYDNNNIQNFNNYKNSFLTILYLYKWIIFY